MNKLKNIFLLLTGALVIVSCNKQVTADQPNPNNPTSVTPQLILGTILTSMSGLSGSGGTGSLGGIQSWDYVQQWNQYHCQNFSYSGNNIYSWVQSTKKDQVANTAAGPFNSYLVLKNELQMENAINARGGSKVNPYEAIGRFVKAYYYYNMTSLMGDVPLTQALGTSQTPSYTPQEQVYVYVLNQLDSANSDLATLIANSDNTLSVGGTAQDIYYGGNLTKWQKLVNAFTLRVLISLSPKASDATLNVPGRFANIMSHPSQYPLFAAQTDDFAFNYNPGGTPTSGTYSIYPLNPVAYGGNATKVNMADTYVSSLTSLNDPRVFVTCDPAWGLPGLNPANPTQFKYFVGASTGLDLGTMSTNATAGLYANINRKRYYSNYTGDPDVLVGYKEMLFNIAEGIERGWAGGNAETFYKTGITESFKFYGLDVTQTNFTAYFLPAAANSLTKIAPYPFTFNWANYYAQPTVQLSSTPATAINQVVLQKYIAMFENSGYEAYYNWRRTGVPAFEGGTGVGNNGVIPIRWTYPTSEQTQNTANWNAALQNQGFSADDVNQKIWLLK
jgi:hypothetical protein